MITKNKNGSTRKPGYTVWRLTPSFKIQEGKVTSYYRFWDNTKDPKRPFFNSSLMVPHTDLFPTFESARDAAIERLVEKREKINIRIYKAQAQLAKVQALLARIPVEIQS